MKTTNQSGHEQNVTNLSVLITVINTLGQAYNPPKPSLTIPGLTELLERGKLEITAVNVAEISNDNALSAQTSSFDGFDSLITRSINALRIMDVPAQTLAQAEAIVRNLHGKRASALLTDEEVAAAKAEGNNAKQVVVHNSTIDSKLENMTKYVLFLESIPQYMPNEPELTVNELKNKLTDMKAKHAQHIQTHASLEAARLQRNKVLYTESTGLVDTAQDVKRYTKSAFGATSPQYKQVSAIEFFKH